MAWWDICGSSAALTARNGRSGSGLCVDSLNTAKEPALTMLHVLSAAGAQLVFFPEAFTALMHFLCDSPRLNSELRKTVETISFQLVKTLASSTREFPHPGVAQRWRAMLAWFRRKQRIFGSRQQIPANPDATGEKH